MNRGFYLILSASLLVNVARCEELIPGICWFDAPPHMERYVENNDPGDNPFSMESKAIVFQSGNQTANLSAISFAVRVVGATIGQGKVVTINPISDAQLKLLMASEVDQVNTNATKIEDITLAGQKALVAQFSLHDVYWVRVRPNKVLVIRLRGGNASLLNSVRANLSSLKINVSNKPESVFGSLAKDAVQLGMSSDEAHKLCGRPFDHSGSDEFYISAKYLIEVQFQGSQFQTNDSASFISYTRLRDSEKFLENPSRAALKAQVQPLDETSAKEILTQQTSGGKLKWTSTAKNRWKRSDGAMAALTNHALVIATAENWPKIHLSE